MDKFILQKATDFNDNTRLFLRYINRETPSYYISEAQRFVNFTNNLMYFEKDFNHKFKKNSTSYKLLNNLNFFKELECKVEYDFLFKTDTRVLFHEDIDSLKSYNPFNSFSILENSYGFDSISRDDSIIALEKYLKKTFDVKKTINFSNYSFNPVGSDILSLSSTIFQVTHFNQDIPQISYKLNLSNKSIVYWLFEDKIVYSIVIGIDNF